MKMYCLVRPRNNSKSVSICSGVKATKLTTTSKVRPCNNSEMAALSRISPCKTGTLAGMGRVALPRLSSTRSIPRETANSTHAELIVPVPPMNRTFKASSHVCWMSESRSTRFYHSRSSDIPKPKGLGLPVSTTCANHFDWSYHVSTGVLRLGIACRDVLFKQAQSFTIDVTGGVEVAIVIDATGTCPLAIGKGEFGVDQSTRATGFGRSKEASDRHQMGCVPIGLVPEHRTEHAPARVKNALGQLGFRKSANVQIFNRNEVEVQHQIGTQLVQEVFPLVPNFLVDRKSV